MITVHVPPLFDSREKVTFSSGMHKEYRMNMSTEGVITIKNVKDNNRVVAAFPKGSWVYAEDN